jgi:tryptophan 2,3-dioxygenase
MEISPEIAEKLQQLEAKYNAMGQDLRSYLDGLLYADYLTYWDYIHLDTLLSLQSPKTSFPDEQIFIIYHQITELYFRLCLLEMQQLSEKDAPDKKEFLMRTGRINRYFANLVKSFEVMVDGMEKDQFLKFRMSLLPASGFQSAQYRMIEIRATHFYHLIDKEHRGRFSKDASDFVAMFEFIYWKAGATELASGKKTLTLKQFELKYAETLISLADECKIKNLYALFEQFSDGDKADGKLAESLRQLDVYVNVNWPLAHYKSAVRYLQRDPEDIKATGGTNWQKYLPPRFQKRIFYPELWTAEELENWGKGWVEENVFNLGALK